MKCIGVRFVDAQQMTSNVAKEIVYRIGNNNNCDGYEVTYEDGYKSWCPKDTFRKHNSVVTDEKLAKAYETILLSSNYKEYLKAEYIVLHHKIDVLKSLIDAVDKGLLKVDSKLYLIYLEQIANLLKYKDILERRAELEDIKLDK